MATYYVSQQVGSDSNAGTGPASGQAWATVGKAFTSGQAEGNTIYIGPGTYRESTLTTSVAGGASTHVQWIGDPTCQYLTSDKPGRVRITRSDSSDVPQTGVVIDADGVQYHDFYNLYLDGSSDSALFRIGTNVTINDCVLNGGYANSIIGAAGTVNRCYAISTDRAILATGTGLTVNDCVLCGAIGVGGDAAGRGTFNNCLHIGGSGSVGYRYCTCNNCVAIGGTYGYRQVTANNCVAIGYHSGGFYGSSSDTTLRSCTSFYCQVGFLGGTSLDVSTCKAGGCQTNQSGGTSGTVTAIAPALFDWRNLSKIMEPFFLPVRNDGNNTYVPSTDLLGRPRPLGNGTCDRGPWEWPNESLDWTNYQTTAPATKIARAGQVISYLPVKDGDALTVTVKSKWTDTNTSYKPQLILRGTGITTQTDTNTEASNTWDTLTVTATATEDALLEIVFYARDTDTAAALAYFSDLTITVT